MEENLGIENLTPDEYDVFRQMLIEEAWIILSDKRKYVKNDTLNTASKIFHLDRICDFFFLEDELEIIGDFNSLKKTIIVRHFLKDHIKDI
jgi:hypothetical protein